MDNDLISRSALKEVINSNIEQATKVGILVDGDYLWQLLNYAIDNATTVEEEEEPFITECRETSIKENLPLYFVYYEETGVLEIYETETKELFEKRHCYKHLPDYKFKEIVTDYLDWYLDWRCDEE